MTRKVKHRRESCFMSTNIAGFYRASKEEETNMMAIKIGI